MIVIKYQAETSLLVTFHQRLATIYHGYINGNRDGTIETKIFFRKIGKPKECFGAFEAQLEAKMQS